jgi:hypothetical protein
MAIVVHAIILVIRLWNVRYMQEIISILELGIMENILEIIFAWNKNKNQGFINRNLTSFSLLMNCNVICYKYNNFGHTTKVCRSNFLEPPKQNKKEENSKFWRKTKAKEKENSMIVQTALHAQNEGNQWYIDIDYSRHMTSDKRKFLTPKRTNGGIVRFGDNVSTNISGKGTLVLDDGRTKIENVLYVEGLRHNILSERCVTKDTLLLSIMKDVK